MKTLFKLNLLLENIVLYISRLGITSVCLINYKKFINFISKVWIIYKIYY